MSNADSPCRDATNPGGPPPPLIPTAKPTAWVSCVLSVVTIALFLGLTTVDRNSWDELSRFGVLPAASIWAGGYWALVTSAFVHLEIWHIAFNVYWFWKLGSYQERAIGSGRFLAFVVTAAFVSSSCQLALSDATGIGLSGVVYAIFGFMWASRQHYPNFDEVLHPKIIQLFFLWLVLCIVATVTSVLNVGNAAHISGLLFGVLVARSFVVPLHSPAMRAGLAVLMICSIVPLFWCPWSVSWLCEKADQAHAAQNLHLALKRYTQVIGMAPDNAWAYFNRSAVYNALGEQANAAADLKKARELDPKIGNGD